MFYRLRCLVVWGSVYGFYVTFAFGFACVEYDDFT